MKIKRLMSLVSAILLISCDNELTTVQEDHPTFVVSDISPTEKVIAYDTITFKYQIESESEYTIRYDDILDGEVILADTVVQYIPSENDIGDNNLSLIIENKSGLSDTLNLDITVLPVRTGDFAPLSVGNSWYYRFSHIWYVENARGTITYRNISVVDSNSNYTIINVRDSIFDVGYDDGWDTTFVGVTSFRDSSDAQLNYLEFQKLDNYFFYAHTRSTKHLRIHSSNLYDFYNDNSARYVQNYGLISYENERILNGHDELEETKIELLEFNNMKIPTAIYRDE